jgi:hypothetical protein
MSIHKTIYDGVIITARRSDWDRAHDLAVNSVLAGYESGTELALLATGEIHDAEDDNRLIGSWRFDTELLVAQSTGAPDYADEIAARVLDAHAIRPMWHRSGEQIAEAAREGYTLGLGVAR